MTYAVATRLSFVAMGVILFVMLFDHYNSSRRFGVSQQWLRVIKGASAAFVVAMALWSLVLGLRL